MKHKSINIEKKWVEFMNLKLLFDSFLIFRADEESQWTETSPIYIC